MKYFLAISFSFMFASQGITQRSAIGASASTSNYIEYIENKGQWRQDFDFRASLRGGTVFLQGDAIVFDFAKGEDIIRAHQWQSDEEAIMIQHHSWKVKFMGCNAVEPIGRDVQDHYYNFIFGNIPEHWQRHIYPCKTVVYENLWDGIDMVVRSENGNFKCEYIVHPNADPSLIQWTIEGADKTRLEDENIIISTSLGTFVEKAPYTYQISEGKLLDVKCSFTLTDGVFGFLEGTYRKDQMLIIDPVLVAGTFAGSTSGNQLYGYCASYDQFENIYLGSNPSYTNLPATNGVYQVQSGGQNDIGIQKFNPDGSQLLWATYMGGVNFEEPHKIHVDLEGNVYLLAKSRSPDYPVTENAFDDALSFLSDVVVSVLTSDGSELIGSTYFGYVQADGYYANIGIGETIWNPDALGEITLSTQGNVLVAVNTSTLLNYEHNEIGVEDNSYRIAVFELSPNLSVLNWCTSINTAGADDVYDLKVLSNGNIAIAGSSNDSNLPIGLDAYQADYQGQFDGYIMILSPNGQEIIASTWHGAAGDDICYFIDEGPDNSIWVCGMSEGGLIPLNSEYEVTGSKTYIARFNADLSELLQRTRIGSQVSDEQLSYPNAFLVDDCGVVYFSGSRSSPSGISLGFDLTPDAIDTTGNAYLCVIEPDLSALRYATHIKGMHVHGGSSRFSERGVLYQGNCGCSTAILYEELTPWSYALNSNSSCESLVYKFDLESEMVTSSFTFDPITSCLPFEVVFTNLSDADLYSWHFGGEQGWQNIQDSVVTYVYTQSGEYLVQLAVQNQNVSCNTFDTLSFVLTVPDIASDLSLNWELLYDDLCGDNPTMLATYEIGGADSVYWMMNDEVLGSMSTMDYSFEFPGIYNLSLSAIDSSCNYLNAISEEIYIGPMVLAMIDVSEEIPNCAPVEIQFDSELQNANNLSWFVNDQPEGNEMDLIMTFNEPGNYEVMLIAQNDLSCNIADTSTIIFSLFDPSDLSMSWEIPEQDSCLNILNLLGSFTGTGADELQWSYPGGTSESVNIDILIDQLGTYTITLVGTDEQCDVSDTLQVIYNLSGTADVFISASSTSGCAPFDLVLSAEGFAGSVQWIMPNQNTSDDEILNYTISSAGEHVFTLIGFLEGACVLSDTSTIVISALPPMTDINWELSSEGTTCDSVIIVSGVILGSNFSSMNWSSGYGSFSDQPTVQFVYEYPGIYLLELQVENEYCDQVATFSEELEMPDFYTPFEIYIPNVFTPNQDDMNSRFRPVFDPDIEEPDFEKWDMRIFNRWGDSVFVSNSATVGWDGREDDIDLPAGVYYYVASYQRRCVDIHPSEKSGYFTLLR
ncbi:MAG: gliding motility-associated C-terminal domain-containing protein [Flavobacteriales bacterium]|nr:gliding motility-associated C-terminal domain-containing protein [Flavobacteriales bacterium]